MAEKFLFLLLVYFGTETLAQHSEYSLQSAVDALRRREAQLALRNSFNEPPSPSHFISAGSDDEDLWNQEAAASPPVQITHHQLNKLLARYLAGEDDERERDNELGPYEIDFDGENYLQDDEKKKRSFFRERGGKYEPTYASVFRERELAPYETPELAQEFLREIEHEKDLERERKYKDALQKLWEKYEQQENEIKEDLFDEDEKKKRQLLPYLSPMEKKRSYPILPWLPGGARKKRFPVAKRSPRASNEALFGASGTEEKVAHDLEAIFNEPIEDKRKRSAESNPSSTPESPDDANIDKKNVSPKPHPNEHNHNRGHHDEASSEEESHEGHAHVHDHDHEEDEEDDHDFDDEDEEDKKKKREIASKKRSTQEIVREDQILPGDLNEFRKKKSVDWSKYFGMDRRKKSEDWFMRNNNEMKKRSTTVDNDDKRKKKSETDVDRLENMDKKLKTIEDLIIDETVKYTGAHEGISNPDDIRSLKDHVVSRLATAYSLEKMRRALDKLKQSVDDENHLQKNEIEPSPSVDEKEKAKRVAVKKEKVDFENNNQHSTEQSEEKNREQLPNELDDDKKKKKKRNGPGIVHHYSDLNLNDFEDELGAGHFEPQLYEGYPASRSYNYLESNQCPMLDAMAERCRGVDLLSGDVRQEFLPICGVHQLCYLCGTSQTACDFQYLSDADSICGRNNDCQSAARAALMILRGTPGPQLGPRECMKNHCLYRAMKEIGL